jgi:hypothetical protein
MCGTSAEAEERQNKHDHNDKTDEIDDSVHWGLLLELDSSQLSQGTEPELIGSITSKIRSSICSLQLAAGA